MDDVKKISTNHLSALLFQEVAFAAVLAFLSDFFCFVGFLFFSLNTFVDDEMRRSLPVPPFSLSLK